MYVKMNPAIYKRKQNEGEFVIKVTNNFITVRM